MYNHATHTLTRDILVAGSVALPCKATNYHVWDDGAGLSVLHCLNAAEVLNTTHRLLVIPCEGGDCGVQPSISCSDASDSTQTAACSETDLQDPSHAVTVRDFTDEAGNLYGRYYMCPPGMTWSQRGKRGRLTQCQHGRWRAINASCVVDYRMPRDCSDVARLGFNETGEYLVRPSYHHSGSVVKSKLFALVWPPLQEEGKNLKEVEVRVRPQEYDAAMSCPLLGVSEESWRTTPDLWQGSVPLSRVPGVTVEITCVEEARWFYEDMSGPRWKSEVLACENQESGGPMWNSSVPLPCKPRCPPGFTNHEGLCYVVVSPVVNLTHAQGKCEPRGASLAFPEKLDTLAFFATLIREEELASSGAILSEPRDVILGLNDAWGDWTAGGLFSPDDTVVSMATTTPGAHWRVLVVPPDPTRSPALRPARLSEGTATHAVCMLFGPVGCWTEPPPPTPNMTQVWENNATHLTATVTYRCLRGYFVDGNTSRSEQTSTCLGIAGGWLPACVDEVPSLPSGFPANITGEDFRYLDGRLTNTCPQGMTTAQGHTNQTVICSLNPNGASYTFLPPVLSLCQACTEDPPTPGAHMAQGNGTHQVGSSLLYTCEPGFLVHPRQVGEAAGSSVEVECAVDHRWMYEGPLECLPCKSSTSSSTSLLPLFFPFGQSFVM
ncbi:hypothetical protein GWK47_055138 [Chionoecetes opilio]|uniref:Sushi domain-containing protein n=1 Tax=Chionoecetes opilio TaxID=41210 RepID=A0A8J4XXT6_CHIOP|nr:hypothetical protein GWK47_055138 [Chionoecetes opilio]